MAQWIEFKADYDHPHADGMSLSAYRAGQVLYVAKDVAEAALAAKVAKPSEKPEGGSDAAPAASADDGRDARLAQPDGADAHRGDLRVELRDAAAGERQAG